MALTRSELEILIKKRAAIVITTFAAVLAINTLLGGSNSSKILNNTIEANNQWAWYQAKNVRSVIYETAGKQEDVKRMKSDMEEISVKAKKLEADRNHAKERSPYYTYAGSLLQIGIVLSTAAILAVSMPLFFASMGVGSIGVILFLTAQVI